MRALRGPAVALALAAALLALAGCGGASITAAPECRSDEECPAHARCVAKKCLQEILLDSGVRPDGEPRDAEPRDAEPRDAEPRDGEPRDAALADTGPADAGAPDLGVRDAGPTDAGSALDAAALDAGLPDAAPFDGGALDAAAPDATLPDTGVRDAGAPDAGGPVSRGAYDFQRITTGTGIPINHELTHAAVSPDDRRLVVSERYDVLYLVDVATDTSSISVRLPKDTNEPIAVESIAWAPDGSYLLVAGTAFLGANNTPEARLYRASPTLGGLVRVGARTSGRHFQAIAFDGAASTAYLLGYNELQGGGYLLALQSYDDAARTLSFVAQDFVSAGCQGLAIADDGLGGRGLVYVCGINGAVVGVYSLGAFMPGGNTGNTSHIAARPQGDYALAVAWSGGRLVRFDRGVWTLGFAAPSLGTSSAWNLAFSSDGARALVTGQYFGGSATLREYRHGAYTTNELSDVSIAGFDLAPWLGGTGVNLNEVAWRPSGDCGYLVGGCSSLSCARGYLVRFSVLNGRPCP